MVRQLLTSKYDLSSVEVVAHGGASAAKELPAEAHKKRSGMLSGSGYGLSEVNGVASSLAGDDYHHRPASIGFPPPVVDLRIVDPVTLVAVKDGQEGELWIKGPGVCKVSCMRFVERFGA